MALPVVIRCDCGGEARGNLGEVVTCPSCRRRYETAGVRSDQVGAAYRMQVHTRVLGKIGMGVVGLVAVVAFFQFGRPGLFAGLLGTGVVWYALLMPYLKRRMARDIAASATTRIDAG